MPREPMKPVKAWGIVDAEGMLRFSTRTRKKSVDDFAKHMRTKWGQLVRDGYRCTRIIITEAQ